MDHCNFVSKRYFLFFSKRSFLHLVQTLPRVRELYFQTAKKNENDHKSWGCIHACTCWIETSWLFSFSPCPFLLHVYSLFLSFVISYFRSNSIRSYIILNVSFSSNRRWKVDGWKLLTIMDFVHHFFFNQKHYLVPSYPPCVCFPRFLSARWNSNVRESREIVRDLWSFFWNTWDCATV